MRRWPNWWTTLAIVLLIACRAPGEKEPGEKPMTEVPNADPQTPATSEAPARPLKANPAAAVPPRGTPPPEDWESPRPYVTEELNSRLCRPAPAGRWAIRWEAPLSQDNYPQFVLAAGDRIVVQGNRQWQLLDGAGKALALGPIALSDIVLDPAQQAFFLADTYGYLAAHSSREGRVLYRASVHGVQTQFRQFFVRRGPRFLIASWEQDLNPHGRVVPSNGNLEVREFGDPVPVKGEFADGTRQLAVEDFTAPRLFAAANGARVAVALRDEVLFTDVRLSEKSRYAGDFEPVALSLDETGRVYLLVKTGGQTALWSVTTAGEKKYETALPADAAIAERPPAVALDHRAFVHSATTVYCIQPDGKIAWQQQPGGTIAGLAITADDQLLVAAGQNLLLYDAKGTRRILREFAPDTLVTPPAMLRDGNIVVASRTKLYRILPMR